MKLMEVGTYWQRVRVLQFPAEVVGKAIAGSYLVGGVLDWDFVVRVNEMDEGKELPH